MEVTKLQPLLPSGKYEMPLVIQDRMFNADGSFSYPSVGIEPSVHPFWVNAFLGNTIMVNGKVWPNMNVDKGQYRFRFLNGSNSRFYNLSFSNGMSFIQIGSDGGYIKSPVPLTSLLLAPAERADIIVDFSSLASGTKVILHKQRFNRKYCRGKQTVGQIMQFTITDQTGPTPFNIAQAPNPFNPTLADSFPTLPTATKQRSLTLFEVTAADSTHGRSVAGWANVGCTYLGSRLSWEQPKSGESLTQLWIRIQFIFTYFNFNLLKEKSSTRT